MSKIVLTLSFIFLLLSDVLAQYPFGISNKNYQKALHLYSKGQIKKADKIFNELIIKEPKNANYYSLIGRHYYEQNRFFDAVYYFEMGSKSIQNGKTIFAFPLAKAYFRADLLEKAAQSLKNFNPASPELKFEVAQLQKAIDFSKLKSYNTHNVKVENVLGAVNSPADDYAPSYLDIDKDLIFTRKINGIDENFFISSLDSCNYWSIATDIGFPINSTKPESYQNRAFSGKYMIYQKCDNRSNDGYARGGCDLYLSYNLGKEWSEPKTFGYTINTTAFEGMPFLNPDENALYFVSDRQGGYGGKDIWVSYFKNGLWQIPKNLGPNINTENDEITPIMAADGKTLFFASNGKPGFGGFDIYTAKLKSDSTFTLATNLGLPINSNFDDLAGSLTLDGKYMYFSSDRVGGYGGLDIYKAEIPAIFAPQSMNIIFGKVSDFETKNSITNADIAIVPNDKITDTLYFKSNSGDGTFYAVLPKGQNYNLETKHSFYQTRTDSIRTTLLLNVDSISIPLYVNGYQPKMINDTLHYFDIQSINLENQDSFCVAVSKLITPYSGKIVKVKFNSFVNFEDKKIENQFLEIAKQCLYKMGIEDEYFEFTVWHVIDNQKLDEKYQKNLGKAILSIDHLKTDSN